MPLFFTVRLAAPVLTLTFVSMASLASQDKPKTRADAFPEWPFPSERVDPTKPETAQIVPPGLGHLYLFLRGKDMGQGFSVILEPRNERKTVDPRKDCVVLTGSSNGKLSFRLSLLGYSAEIELQGYSSPTFESNRTVSEVREKIRSGDKEVEHKFVQAIVPFALQRECKGRLKLLGKDGQIWNKGWNYRETFEGRIVLKISRTTNWYFAQVEYSGRKVGPGWCEAQGNLQNGGYFFEPHFTTLREEFGVQWSR